MPGWQPTLMGGEPARCCTHPDRRAYYMVQPAALPRAEPPLRPTGLRRARGIDGWRVTAAKAERRAHRGQRPQRQERRHGRIDGHSRGQNWSTRARETNAAMPVCVHGACEGKGVWAGGHGCGLSFMECTVGAAWQQCHSLCPAVARHASIVLIITQGLDRR